MSGLDLLIVLAFVAWSVTAGMRARRKASRSLDEYYLAGRGVKGWRAGISMAATQFAADTPLLFCGLIATAGIFAMWRVWVYGFAILLLGFLFAGQWRRARILTDAELVELRYDSGWRLPLRVTKAIYFGLVINAATLGFVLLAALQIFELFLPWHTWLSPDVYRVAHALTGSIGLDLSTGAATYAAPFHDRSVATTNNAISVALLLLFVGLYSTTGGLRGVIASDLMQFGLAMAGTVVLAVVLVTAGGGIPAIPERLVELYGELRAEELLSLTPTLQHALAPFLVIVGLQWIFHMNSDGTGYLAQRCMACPTDREARIAACVFAWVQIVGRSLLWLVIAVALLVLYPFTEADSLAPGFAGARERTFLSAISDHLQPGARGLMVTALFAALASTVDTHLNWGSSYLANDLYRRLLCERWLGREAGARELVTVARAGSVLVLLAGCLVAAHLDSIQQGWRISLLFGAGIGGVLVLRWLWERITVQSEFAAMVIALVGAPLLLWMYPGDDAEWIRLGVMALVSTAGTVAVALLSDPSGRRMPLDFYRRVRPVGFWTHTARLAGDDPAVVRRALGAILLATASAGASLLLTLAGTWKLVMRLPGEPALVPLLLLGGAAALTPFWWRRLTATEGVPA